MNVLIFYLIMGKYGTESPLDVINTFITIFELMNFRKQNKTTEH